jgi:hypothetical protein
MVYPDQGSVASLYLRATMPPCIFHAAYSLVAVSRIVGEVLFDDALNDRLRAAHGYPPWAVLRLYNKRKVGR